ncbi:MAG: TIGR00730 family Rossman fold protein [Deltaproteobacteria bacterium]|nr:TIGR00730 family Rossman fold protein [Deltaproteobacteria bacterium]MCZ6624780.1 TIGR00730 family Rossman fold protein [Deltaproteobacteria bacterium]
MKREQATSASLEHEILEWIERGRGSSDEDFIAEMIQTILKLAGDEASRGDLKILNRALKELRYAFKVFAPYRSIRKVSIFGSTRIQEGDPYYRMAVELGRRLADEDFMVITGAGAGIMQAGHEGAGRKRSFGVNIQLPFVQKPNRFIRNNPKLITFHFFFTRKLMFVKEADAVVFFPGGFGTHDELIEALTLAQTGKSQIVPILLIDRPGKGYWRKWEDFVQREMLNRGFVSEQDLSFFKIVEEVETAIQEIRNFYSNYHSYRFVNRDLVIRLVHPPTAALIDGLNRDFRDILKEGEVKETGPLPEESDDPETLSLHRLLVPFNREDFGRLRQMIDAINGRVS